MSWYKLEAQETLDKLQTTDKGLPQDTAQKRLIEYGPNIFARKDKVSKIKILLHQFYSPLIFILLIAAIVTIFLHEYIDTGVILAVVILNAIIGYVQEFKAEESMRALENMVLPMAKVIRDGKEKEIKSEDLVPGDIVLLTSGVRIPADIRLFKTIELKVDEAALTGESVPAEKITTAVSSNNLTPGDQKNMGFMGTIVVSGRGRGVVVEIGNNTILGQIAKDVEGSGYTPSGGIFLDKQPITAKNDPCLDSILRMKRYYIPRNPFYRLNLSAALWQPCIRIKRAGLFCF